MLRVSPDGSEVWVQTSATNTNVVLSADDLSVLSTQPLGKAPVTNAWTPDGSLSFVTHANDTFASVLDAATYRELKRIEVGQNNTNIGFTRDGRTAFIAVTGTDSVAVIDVAGLQVVGHLPAGTQPSGLVILETADAAAAPVQIPRALPRTGDAGALAPNAPVLLAIGSALMTAGLALKRRRGGG